MSILKTDLSFHMKEDVVLVLKQQGICTATQFLTQDIEDIVQNSSTKLHFKELLTARQLLLSTISSPIINGCHLYNSTKLNHVLLSTGNISLDKLLTGGLYSGEVTEICGGIAVGKTQLCMSCACRAGIDKYSVYYIDTSCSFSATRTVQLIGEHHKNLEKILSDIKHAICTDIYEIFEVLENIRENLSNQNEEYYKKLKLVIIDCVASVIYPILGGNQIDGHGLLIQLGQMIKSLAVEYSLAVLIMNNVVYTYGGKPSPSLGRTWSHIPHTRLMVSSTNNNSNPGERRATLIKSSKSFVPSSTMFNLPEAGDDVKLR